MLAASEAAAGNQAESRTVIEESLPFDALPERPDDIVEKVATALKPPAGVDLDEWYRAREIFLTSAASTLERVIGRKATAKHDEFVMEAIIIPDGSRPSFMLKDCAIPADDPFIGNWQGSIAAAGAAGIEKLACAVGRIQPVGGHASKFSGTGTLIDRDNGLVLTNFHVIEHARTRFGVAMDRHGDRLTVRGKLEIDFAGEADSLDERRFRIIEAIYPQGAGETFSGIDAAVCRIVPHDGDTVTSLPDPPALLSVESGYINGSISSLAVIGFPAPPSFDSDQVDWEWVMRTLFANRFGVKRLAPGQFTEKRGTHPADLQRLAIGHDATTFGGASGSLVSAWLDDRTPGFALHFGGLTLKGNYALAFAAVRDKLAAIGVPI